MPTLPLSEIKDRSYGFVNKWKNYDGKEKAESQSFWNDFFDLFGISRKSVAEYEASVTKLNGNTGSIDLFWPGTLLVEQKRAGRSLEAAKKQAYNYFLGLSEKERPRYIVVSDFLTISLLDLNVEMGAQREHTFALEELPSNVGLFAFMAGYKRQVSYRDLDLASIKAAQKMAKLYELILKNNAANANLDLFMVRLLYCLFAGDTQIIEQGTFRSYLSERTREDGSDLGQHLSKIFEVLNTPEIARSKALDEQLAGLPYINGGLFEDNIYIPDFDSQTRANLLEVCNFGWQEISPSIFGSLFQDISSEERRRMLGEHYTSKENILKTLRPLFLDALWQKFNQAGSNIKKLEALLVELENITILDPACGCGNFLVVAYRELRNLELKIFEKRYAKELKQGIQHLDTGMLSRVTVEQFYGFEIEAFPAKIAQVALWLTDHQMNLKFSQVMGHYYARIPLTQSAHIKCLNALQCNWAEQVPLSQLSYIVGNPPFVGSSLKNKEQQAESDALWYNVKGGKDLDYVANWYLKAAQIMQQQPKVVSAFVSTNSISQGNQVASLWLNLFNNYGVKIHFAHRTFVWNNEAGKVAKVHCVIVGFGCFNLKTKRLWDYDDVKGKGSEQQVANINPYLLAADDIIVKSRSTPIEAQIPAMTKGSQPTDKGKFLFNEAEKEAFLQNEPQAAPFLRPCLGAKEFINNKKRYCLWLVEATPSQLKAMPKVLQQIEAVRQFRLKSGSASTRKSAEVASLFQSIRQPASDYLLIPRHSSERRIYIPIGYVAKEVIATDAVFTLPNASPYLFGVLASLMHMVWTKYVCGRIKSDYRYSNTLVYNNFPFPHQPKPNQIAKVEERANALLALRQAYLAKGESYATLYDPNTMPSDLLKAHKALDSAVDSCYAAQKTFNTELNRIEFLFEQYKNRLETLLATP